MEAATPESNQGNAAFVWEGSIALLKTSSDGPKDDCCRGCVHLEGGRRAYNVKQKGKQNGQKQQRAKIINKDKQAHAEADQEGGGSGRGEWGQAQWCGRRCKRQGEGETEKGKDRNQRRTSMR